MNETEKKIADITNLEWALYEWIETTPMGADDRVFIKGRERTPDETCQADKDFKQWATMRRAQYRMIKDNLIGYLSEASKTPISYFEASARNARAEQ